MDKRSKWRTKNEISSSINGHEMIMWKAITHWAYRTMILFGDTPKVCSEKKANKQKKKHKYKKYTVNGKKATKELFPWYPIYKVPTTTTLTVENCCWLVCMLPFFHSSRFFFIFIFSIAFFSPNNTVHIYFYYSVNCVGKVVVVKECVWCGALRLFQYLELHFFSAIYIYNQDDQTNRIQQQDFE